MTKQLTEIEIKKVTTDIQFEMNNLLSSWIRSDTNKYTVLDSISSQVKNNKRVMVNEQGYYVSTLDFRSSQNPTYKIPDHLLIYYGFFTDNYIKKIKRINETNSMYLCDKMFYESINNNQFDFNMGFISALKGTSLSIKLGVLYDDNDNLNKIKTLLKSFLSKLCNDFKYIQKVKTLVVLIYEYIKTENYGNLYNFISEYPELKIIMEIMSFSVMLDMYILIDLIMEVLNES